MITIGKLSKQKLQLLACICLGILISSCQDVVDVDVPEAAPRLVIEASIDWEKGTAGNQQTVLLSTTTAYFDTTSDTAVTGAQVKITNGLGTEFIFEDQNDGSYTTTTFVPEISQTYTLEVIYNGETYTGIEQLVSVTDIAEITQSVDGGFDEEVIEVNLFFDDPVAEENYYLTQFKVTTDFLPFLLAVDDEFTNGNRMEIFYEKEDDDDDELLAGNIVDIVLYGVTERYYNYIDLLIDQTEAGGDPFATVPAELRGNCINTTNAANYPYGYFRLGEVAKAQYIVE